MIYVLGSINMDMVMTVPYLPKNGETLSADKFYINPGGKGANQAVAIAKLGGAVKMIGKVGRDANGRALKENLSAFGVDVSCVTETETSSGLAMIIVEGGDNRIILYKGANHCVCEADVNQGLKDACPGDILIMQLEIPIEIVEYAAAAAKNKGMTVILNPGSGRRSFRKSYAERGRHRAERERDGDSYRRKPVGDVELALAVKKLYSLGVKKVIVTLGARGAAVAEGQNIDYIPARKVKAVDTTSAGDTFVGACALKLSEGKTLKEAAEFAAVASSITITREGAAVSIPSLKEVQEVIDSEK